MMHLCFILYTYWTPKLYYPSIHFIGEIRSPTWHHPIRDLAELRRQNPPASVVGLLCRVHLKDHSGKADLPQSHKLEPAVDPRPRYEPVRTDEGYHREDDRNEVE